MKVIATINPGGMAHERKYLVEMTNDEIWELSGRTCGTAAIQPGLEMDLPKILYATGAVVKSEGKMQEAAKNLRALAELLDSVSGDIREAIKTEVSDNQ